MGRKANRRGARAVSTYDHRTKKFKLVDAAIEDWCTPPLRDRIRAAFTKIRVPNQPYPRNGINIPWPTLIEVLGDAFLFMIIDALISDLTYTEFMERHPCMVPLMNAMFGFTDAGWVNARSPARVLFNAKLNEMKTIKPRVGDEEVLRVQIFNYNDDFQKALSDFVFNHVNFDRLPVETDRSAKINGVAVKTKQWANLDKLRQYHRLYNGTTNAMSSRIEGETNSDVNHDDDTSEDTNSSSGGSDDIIPNSSSSTNSAKRRKRRRSNSNHKRKRKNKKGKKRNRRLSSISPGKEKEVLHQFAKVVVHATKGKYGNSSRDSSSDSSSYTSNDNQQYQSFGDSDRSVEDSHHENEDMQASNDDEHNGENTHTTTISNTYQVPAATILVVDDDDATIPHFDGDDGAKTRDTRVSVVSDDAANHTVAEAHDEDNRIDMPSSIITTTTDIGTTAATTTNTTITATTTATATATAAATATTNTTTTTTASPTAAATAVASNDETHDTRLSAVTKPPSRDGDDDDGKPSKTQSSLDGDDGDNDHANIVDNDANTITIGNSTKPLANNIECCALEFCNEKGTPLTWDHKCMACSKYFHGYSCCSEISRAALAKNNEGVCMKCLIDGVEEAIADNDIPPSIPTAWLLNPYDDMPCQNLFAGLIDGMRNYTGDITKRIDAELKDLRSRLAKRENTIQQRNILLAASKERVWVLEQGSRVSRELVIDLQDTINKDAQNIDALHAEVENLTANVTTLEDENRVSIEQHEAKIVGLEDVIRFSTEQHAVAIDALHARSAESEERHNVAIAAREKTIGERDDLIHQSTTNLDESQQIIAGLQQTNEGLRADLTASEAINRQQETEIAELRQSFEAFMRVAEEEKQKKIGTEQ